LESDGVQHKPQEYRNRGKAFNPITWKSSDVEIIGLASSLENENTVIKMLRKHGLDRWGIGLL
jgi:hypothetical protein